MKAAHRRLIGYILAGGNSSMGVPCIARDALPDSKARAMESAEAAGLVEISLGVNTKTGPRREWVLVNKGAVKAFHAAQQRVNARKKATDPLEKLTTLELVTHLKRTPADWGRGFRILGKRWVGQFKSQADFDRQMRDAIAGTRQAAAGRGEARLEPVAIEAMEKGRPYLVTGGGGVWFSRGPIEHNETLKAYLVIVP